MLTIRKSYDPFEILFKNFFDNDSEFNTVLESEYKYPVDLYETKEGLQIDIAAIGLEEKDIEVKIEDGNILRISYVKKQEICDGCKDGCKECEDLKILHKGIARRSFNFGWRIGSKYNIKKINVILEKGLLSINIPFAESQTTKVITINKHLIANTSK